VCGESASSQAPQSESNPLPLRTLININFYVQIFLVYFFSTLLEFRMLKALVPVLFAHPYWLVGRGGRSIKKTKKQTFVLKESHE
jgi:hypothetical protein